MARSNNRRSDRKSGLHLRARRKSFPRDPVSLEGPDEIIYDVPQGRPMLLRVCWERNLAVLADATPYVPRARETYVPVATSPSRIRQISL